MKARTARITATGGPEVIEWVDTDVPDPGPGEVTMFTAAVGLNYIDAYFRSGLYPMALPNGLGFEAVGAVGAIGPGVTHLKPGDRVGCFGPSHGAYTTLRNISAQELIPIPDDIEDRTAAAILLKGCTAEFLVDRCAKVEEGQTVLVYAAAGGVGTLLCGWLKSIGANVIGTVGRQDKVDTAHIAGADHVIVHSEEDVVARVKEITDGAGVPIILDGVGGAMWETSLACAQRRGLIVSFGNAGGAVTGVGLGDLARNGSLFVTRPTLFDYYAGYEERRAGVARLFAQLRAGVIEAEIGQTFALEDAADAHRALEAGETRGSTVLTVA